MPLPPKILVVDDAKAVRDLAKRALAPLKSTLSDAANGYNALFAMEKSLPDLLVLDVKMPIMDGLELLTMMRSNAQLAKIPVVMLTSPTDHVILPQLTTLGVAAILQKPFPESALLDAARAALGR
jgi:CheY-like chemotaxis protein